MNSLAEWRECISGQTRACLDHNEGLRQGAQLWTIERNAHHSLRSSPTITVLTTRLNLGANESRAGQCAIRETSAWERPRERRRIPLIDGSFQGLLIVVASSSRWIHICRRDEHG